MVSLSGYVRWMLRGGDQMRFGRLVALLVVLSPVLGPAQKAKKHDVPAAFMNARYVYVEAESGGDITNPDVYPEDRQAISNVESGVKQWNRYAIAIRKNQADLVFRIRKGRLVGVQGHATVSAGAGPGPSPTQTPRPGMSGDELGASSEVGPNDDLLQVFSTGPDGKLLGPIWTREMKDGLDAPRVLLLQQLKDAVERAYPNPPPNKQH
jgi:hypothetical protein